MYDLNIIIIIIIDIAQKSYFLQQKYLLFWARF